MYIFQQTQIRSSKCPDGINHKRTGATQDGSTAAIREKGGTKKPARWKMKDDDRLQQQSSHRHAARMMEKDGLVKATWARVGKIGEVDNDDDDDDNNNNSRYRPEWPGVAAAWQTLSQSTASGMVAQCSAEQSAALMDSKIGLSNIHVDLAHPPQQRDPAMPKMNRDRPWGELARTIRGADRHLVARLAPIQASLRDVSHCEARNVTQAAEQASAAQ
ncbi:hypothetical protein E5D57_001280 [Metarhizium anisopliae]|nr:hypothetical protein E5D57_001280 [Metarhizium anisopliae]